ncbi:MAG: HNH endonuclease [bacterium]
MLWEIQKIVSKGHYNYAVVPNHPKAIKYGYVLEHRVIVENNLNRILNDDEVIHHINENKKDNRIENLEVTSKSEHTSHHGKQKGRLYLKLKCPWCQSTFNKPKNQSHLQKPGQRYSTCSQICRGKFSSSVQHGLLLDEDYEIAIFENIISEYKAFLP